MSIEQVVSDIEQGKYSNQELIDIIDAIKHVRSHRAGQVKNTIEVGSSVQFVSAKMGQVFTGTVEKVAVKYATVVTDNNGTWKVPLSMIEII